MFVDSLDIFTAAIFLVIFLLVIFSSLYDRILRNTTSLNADNHYKNSPLLKMHQTLTLFSIRRNWYILSAPAKAEVRDLRFIQAIRTLTMFGVVIGHCGWFSIILPSYNPIFIEDVRTFYYFFPVLFYFLKFFFQIYSNISSMLVVNGINLVQSFFVIGGFLTAFLFMVHAEEEKNPGIILVLKTALLRYIRFAPLLILAILMHSTWLYRFGTGPLWDKVNFAERQFCRENWWINMLFLDNYINVENKCLIHRFEVRRFFMNLFKLFCS